jgi:transposase
MGKSEAARSFGVSLSSVKRYVGRARQGSSLSPRKHPGPRPKTDEQTRKLLEADVEERPECSLRERGRFLERVAGVRVSESTLSRLLRRMGFSPKKTECGCEREGRVLEGCLACPSGRQGRGRTLRVRGRDGCQHLTLSPIYGWARRGQRAYFEVPRNWGASDLTLLSSMTRSGMGPSLAVEGPTTREVFEAYP